MALDIHVYTTIFSGHFTAYTHHNDFLKIYYYSAKLRGVAKVAKIDATKWDHFQNRPTFQHFYAKR